MTVPARGNSPMAREVLAEAVPEFDAVIHLTWCPKPVVEYFLTQVYCLEDSLQANCDWGLLRDLLKALKVPRVCFLLAPKTNFGPNSSTNLAVMSDRKRKADDSDPLKVEKLHSEVKNEVAKSELEVSSQEPVEVDKSEGDFIMQKCTSKVC